MKMPKRFLYAAVLPLCGFIGYSFFSYYAFADEAGELELNFGADIDKKKYLSWSDG